MRPQQQNRRMRGRNNNGGGNNNSNSNNNSGNNNRKGPNPLTRNYESNGPDVKIRGSAQQIAEKYTTLARDSHSSGDRVMAENYLQHAEHYNRIIAAAQAQMPVQQNRFDGDEEGGDDDMDIGNANNQGFGNGNSQGQPNQQRSNEDNGSGDNGSGPQPVIDGTPAEVAYNKQASQNREERRPRAHVANSGQGTDAEATVAPIADAAQGGDDGEEERQQPARRPRRPRRPRIEQNAGASNNETPGNDAPAPEPVAAAASEAPAEKPPLVTSDS
ncbi:DUF4167 domain-containing protein [Mesorhizobium sp. NBSH29]|uniref:DUF4167 domain-containing protein n=1 Tax=Mesorhizobium sp. NBSH29 TaxID=2654249 RepID=UPI0018964850|nr:DUF4167 domain-containing protein [Mesorhizobium sp. NBSH29]QPC85617.1 DUF4167 domain-containing protein [Mesorhizobium sp. NBSH29]